MTTGLADQFVANGLVGNCITEARMTALNPFNTDTKAGHHFHLDYTHAPELLQQQQQPPPDQVKQTSIESIAEVIDAPSRKGTLDKLTELIACCIYSSQQSSH